MSSFDFHLLYDSIQDGFDSSSQASSGSTRSTSSSFLRYQNRAVVKARLITNAILQRRGDGSETPLENETRPWPMFDRIYRGQNQLKKENLGEGGAENDDDNDSVSSKGSDLGFEGEACAYEVEFKQHDQKGKPQENSMYRAFRSFLGARTSVYSESSPVQVGKTASSPNGSLVEPCSVVCIQVGSLDSTFEPFSQSTAQCNDIEIDTKKKAVFDHTDEQLSFTADCFNESLTLKPEAPLVTVKESGTTFEAHKAPQIGDDSEIKRLLPNQIESQLPSTTSALVDEATAGPSRRSSHRKMNVSADISEIVVPRSIPPTIQYSLRTAVGDGSVRQRNNHSLMERRPLRPNGCAVDVSYWSHCGKRHYMEGKCKFLMILFASDVSLVFLSLMDLFS
jgi:hypothetical protein